MKIIEPSFEILDDINGKETLKKIELAARTCYKSEDKITDDSAEKFVRNHIQRGHESALEHEKVSVRIICDRGVSHELVRHRLASYSQESACGTLPASLLRSPSFAGVHRAHNASGRNAAIREGLQSLLFQS